MAVIVVITYVITIVVLLLFSAFFSGSETALFSLSNFQRKKIESKNPHIAKTVSLLLDTPRRTLATILIGNMLVNIAATSIATIMAISLYGEKGIAFSIVLMTLLLLITGEVTPKTLAIRKPQEFVLFCSRPLHLFGKIIWPLRVLMRFIADIFISIFVIKKQTKPYVTQQELKALMSISEREGIIEKDEEEMIRTIFDFGQRSIDEIMTPRVDIIGCEKSASGSDLIQVMRTSKHTKIPIYDKTVDNIVGVVYTKDFMLHPTDGFSEFVAKPLYVPEKETIDDLLIKFQSQKIYIAVVLDEFGGTSGIVTLEDVLEEIVGEIRDEYDKEEIPIRAEDDGTFTIIGKTSIWDVNEELGLDLPMAEVTTINGLILLLLGRVPRRGEYIRFKNVEFHILDVKKNMVTKTQLKKL